MAIQTTSASNSSTRGIEPIMEPSKVSARSFACALFQKLWENKILSEIETASALERLSTRADLREELICQIANLFHIALVKAEKTERLNPDADWIFEIERQQPVIGELIGNLMERIHACVEARFLNSCDSETPTKVAERKLDAIIAIFESCPEFLPASLSDGFRDDLCALRIGAAPVILSSARKGRHQQAYEREQLQIRALDHIAYRQALYGNKSKATREVTEVFDIDTDTPKKWLKRLTNTYPHLKRHLKGIASLGIYAKELKKRRDQQNTKKETHSRPTKLWKNAVVSRRLADLDHHFGNTRLSNDAKRYAVVRRPTKPA